VNYPFKIQHGFSTKYIAYSFYMTQEQSLFIKKTYYGFFANYFDSVLNHLNAHLLHFLTDICLKEHLKCHSVFFVYAMKVNGVQCCSGPWGLSITTISYINIFYHVPQQKVIQV